MNEIGRVGAAIDRVQQFSFADALIGNDEICQEYVKWPKTLNGRTWVEGGNRE